MELEPFLLDEWLGQKFSADPPIEFDLGSSTGPVWTLRELLDLEGAGAAERLFDTALFYTSPHGTPELRAAIAAMQSVDPDHVQMVTGAAEALLILFHLAAEPDANILLPEPGFPSYDAVAKSLGIELRHYHLRREDHFRVDLDEVRRLVDRNTKFVLVNSPHNPIGTVLTDDEMQSLHDFCAERRVGFISDEVYHPIYHGPGMQSAARLPHATVLGDFSKALCLSGLRTGWMIERDPVRRRKYTTARSYFTVSNTVLGEQLAALAVRHRDVIYRRAQRIAHHNLALLESVIAEHSGFLRWVRPAGGMTAFPWLADGSDARDFCRRMAKSGVLLVPGDLFGMRSHFRIGLGASGEKFEPALRRFAEILTQRTSANIGAGRSA